MPPADLTKLGHPERLKTLERLRSLHLSENPAFHRLTRLVSLTLKVPIAYASLIDDERQWFVSEVGLPEPYAELESIPNTSSLCQHAIVESKTLAVEDARQNPLIADLHLVTDIGVVGYLAVPLITSNGEAVGTLCAIDHTPRRWTKDEIAVLHDISLSIMTEIELSLRLEENEQVKAKLAQERDLLRTLIDSFPDYIFVKDSDGRFVISNWAHAQNAAQIDDPDRLVGKTAFDPLELAEQYHTDDRAVIDSGEPLINLERQTIDPDGKLKWVLTSKVPFTSRDKQLRGVVGISRDITAPKAAEEALRERERLIEQILLTSPNTIYVYDIMDRHTRFSNIEFSDALGYTLEELKALDGDAFIGLLHPDDLKRLSNHAERIMQLKDGEVVEIEFRLRTKSGGYRWIYSRDAVFDRDANGVPSQIIGVALDVTQRKQIDTALRESEQRMRMLINHAPVVLLELDDQGIFRLAEGKGLASFGIEPQAINGKSAREALKHQPQILSRIDRALEGETVEFIYDNTRVVYQMSFTPVLTDDGHVSSVIGVGTDVTEQVRARDDATNSNARLKALHDIDANLSASLDLERVLKAAMQAAMDASGAHDGYIALVEDGALRIAESVGCYNSDTILDPTSKQLAEALNAQKASWLANIPAKAPKKESLCKSRAQILVPLAYGERTIGVLDLESLTPYSFDEDQVDFVKSIALRAAVAVENARLYTLSQTQLITLQELYERVRALEQIKTDMIRIAAHDLRNPLTAVNGYVELLKNEQKESLSPAQKSYFETIEGSLHNMHKIVSDILSLQRIEALQEQTNYAAVDLSELVDHLYQEHRSAAEERALNLKLALPTEHLVVRGDQAQLREAIDNLIDNAIKYTPDGGDVEIKLVPENSHIVFEVKDSGFGIPEELHERLFQPFFRAKTKQTRHIQGTGLGLHLVKNIIERHAGRMYFRSTLGNGSTFGFEIAPWDDA